MKLKTLKSDFCPPALSENCLQYLGREILLFLSGISEVDFLFPSRVRLSERARVVKRNISEDCDQTPLNRSMLEFRWFLVAFI